MSSYVKILEWELKNAKSCFALLEKTSKDLDKANADRNAMCVFDEEEIEVLSEREPARVLDLIVQRHVVDMDDDTKEYWRNAIQKLQ